MARDLRELRNDLEPPAIALQPVIGDVERVFAPWPRLGAPVPGKKHRVVQLADSVRSYLPWG